MPTIYNYEDEEDKKVKKLEEDKSGIGLLYPFHSSQGVFEYTTETIEAARSNILHLLDTDKGDRLMKPEVGIGLSEMLFEPINDSMKAKYRKRIKNNIREYVPFVRIDELTIDISNENRDRNEVLIDITFSLKKQSDINDRLTYRI